MYLFCMHFGKLQNFDFKRTTAQRFGRILRPRIRTEHSAPFHVMPYYLFSTVIIQHPSAGASPLLMLMLEHCFSFLSQTR